MNSELLAIARLVILSALGFGLVGAGAYFLNRFIRQLNGGDTPSVDRHWGGLGGSMSGWRMSNSLVHLATALVLATLGATCVLAAVPLEPGGEKAKAETAKSAADGKQNAAKATELEAEVKRQQARLTEAETEAKRRSAEIEAAMKRAAEIEAEFRRHLAAQDAAAMRLAEAQARLDEAVRWIRQETEHLAAERKGLGAALAAMGPDRRLVLVPLASSLCLLADKPPAPAKPASKSKACPPAGAPQSAAQLKP